MSESTEMVTRHGGVVDTSPYLEQTQLYLRFRDDTPEEIWAAVTKKLLASRESLSWWIGDAILAGESKYGETYAQAIEETSLSYSSLSNLVYVSKAVPVENRRSDLSWSHHAEVAGIEDKEYQRRLLAEAAPQPGQSKPRIGRDQLRIRVRNEKRARAIEAGEAPSPVSVNELSFGEMRDLAESKLQDYYEDVDFETGEVIEGEVVEDAENECPFCGGTGKVKPA